MGASWLRYRQASNRVGPGAPTSSATFEHTGAEPPLPYSDGYFDLVINHSVFTHLDERYQDMWLEELRRVVMPGGLLILSIHGEFAFQIAEGDAGRRRGLGVLAEVVGTPRHPVRRGRHVYLGGVFPDFYHTTFHSPWYVFSHWSRWFDVKSYLPKAESWTPGRGGVAAASGRRRDAPALTAGDRPREQLALFSCSLEGPSSGFLGVWRPKSRPTRPTADPARRARDPRRAWASPASTGGEDQVMAG